MVHVSANDSVVNLTSEVGPTREWYAWMVENGQRIRAFCKDMHVHHTLNTTHQTSIVGLAIDAPITDIEKEIEELKTKHNTLLEWVDKQVEEDRAELERIAALKQEMQTTAREDNKDLAKDLDEKAFVKELDKLIRRANFAVGIWVKIDDKDKFDTDDTE